MSSGREEETDLLYLSLITEQDTVREIQPCSKRAGSLPIGFHASSQTWFG